RQDRLQRELELRMRRLAVAPVGRLADAHHRYFSPQGATAHATPPSPVFGGGGAVIRDGGGRRRRWCLTPPPSPCDGDTSPADEGGKLEVLIGGTSPAPRCRGSEPR